MVMEDFIYIYVHTGSSSSVFFSLLPQHSFVGFPMQRMQPLFWLRELRCLVVCLLAASFSECAGGWIGCVLSGEVSFIFLCLKQFNQLLTFPFFLFSVHHYCPSLLASSCPSLVLPTLLYASSLLISLPT